MYSYIYVLVFYLTYLYAISVPDCECPDDYFPFKSKFCQQIKPKFFCAEEIWPNCTCPSDAEAVLPNGCVWFDPFKVANCENMADVQTLVNNLNRKNVKVRYCECPKHWSQLDMPMLGTFCVDRRPSKIACGLRAPPVCKCRMGYAFLMGTKYKSEDALPCFKVLGMKKDDCMNRKEIEEYKEYLVSKGRNSTF